MPLKLPKPFTLYDTDLSSVVVVGGHAHYPGDMRRLAHMLTIACEQSMYRMHQQKCCNRHGMHYHTQACTTFLASTSNT